VVEIMGHNAGWLALGAGISGGADVILIPEIPYDIEKVAAAIRRRSRHGSRFSIVAVSEGAMSIEEAKAFYKARANREKADSKKAKAAAKKKLAKLEHERSDSTFRISRNLEALTSLESRVTILGYVQRGGTPSSADRLLASRLGTACIEFVERDIYGVMVAARGDSVEAVPLKDVVGKRKTVPLDHPWVRCARRVGTSLGD
jgi:6-phosphofructokinase 1